MLDKEIIMKVTAKEVISNWVDLDCGAPYHIETHPVGHDRKVHKGPFETNEDFPNTWMPTKDKIEPPCEIGPELNKEDIAIEEVVVHLHAEAEALPGVPMSLFRKWDAAHKAELQFESDESVASLHSFAEALAIFVEAAHELGVRRMYDPNKIRRYVKENPPQGGGDTYGRSETSVHMLHLDRIMNLVHEDVMERTLTDRQQWYDKRYSLPGKNPYSTPEEEREKRKQELREFRGPTAPFLEEMWERRERHGMKITAAEVLEFDPSRRRLKEAPKKPATPSSPMPEFQEIPVETGPYEDITEYDEILYLYDGLPTMLSDYIEPMVKAMQNMTPQQKSQIGKLIRNIQKAIQVLGQ